MQENIGQNIFLTGKSAFSFINLCLQQSLRPKKTDPKSSKVNVKKPSDPYISSLSFITLDNARKSRPKSFLHWKDCLLYQKLLVSTTS